MANLRAGLFDMARTCGASVPASERAIFVGDSFLSADYRVALVGAEIRHVDWLDRFLSALVDRTLLTIEKHSFGVIVFE